MTRGMQIILATYKMGECSFDLTWKGHQSTLCPSILADINSSGYQGGIFFWSKAVDPRLRLGSTALLQKKNSPPNIHMINCSQSDLSYKTNKGKLKKLHIFSVNRKYESINNSFNNRYHSDFSKQSDSPDCYNILLQSTHRTLSWCSCYQNQNS